LLTGPNAAAIVEHATRLLTDQAAYRSMATARNPYGDGYAAERIVQRIRRFFVAPSEALGRGKPDRMELADLGEVQDVVARKSADDSGRRRELAGLHPAWMTPGKQIQPVS
jgi:hypothetical protein